MATRKKSTYRLRIGSALIGLLIGGGSLMLQTLAGASPGNLGAGLFAVLTWMGFIACIAAGPFYTSDCLSEEKREGTLGFLFLTDLRGYDVVSGKLISTSFRAVSSLLALFPVLAITLLLGSVSGGQFTRASLSLVAALLGSLTVGLFVSSISKDSQKAFWGTLGLLFIWLLGGPLFGPVLARVSGRPEFAWLGLTSPAYPFTSAGSTRKEFWASLGIVLVISIAMFALASLLARRTWQDRAAQSTKKLPSRTNTRSSSRLQQRGARLLDRNPVLWLALRQRSQDLGPWALALVAVTAFALMAYYASPGMWTAWNAICSLLVFALYLWAAAQAPRMFVEARRGGLYDLILATPLPARDIVRGQWLALLRVLGVPALLLVLAQIAGAVLAYRDLWPQLQQQGATGVGATAAIGPSLLPAWTSLAGSVLLASFAGLTTLANLVAMSWFGMWMGLTSKTTVQAALKVVVFVQVAPAMAIGFLAGMATMLLVLPGVLRTGGGPGPPPATMLATPLLMALVQAILTILKDIVFYVWSRKRLHAGIRPLFPALAPAPPAGAVPPVISSCA